MIEIKANKSLCEVKRESRTKENASVSKEIKRIFREIFGEDVEGE